MNDFEIKTKILKYFRKKGHEFVSGEEISDTLGVSRAHVWKHIHKLRDDGYGIDAVPHIGYRMTSVPDRVYGYEVASRLDTKVVGARAIHYFESVASTNDMAYLMAEEGEPEGAVVIAETQTKGKGRMGRKWVSPKAGGIYMSVILRPDVEMDEIPTITLVSAMSVARAIMTICALEARVKWPNDIMFDGKKLCGILTEVKAQPDRADFVVLGIGINVNTPQSKLPPAATSLKAESGRSLDRAEVLKAVLEELEKDYQKFSKEGFASMRDDCKAMSNVIGRAVRVTEHHKVLEGVAEDIDEKGALIVRADSGETKRVFSGDVVLCR